MYADIIVDITSEKIDKSFQYRIPPELENVAEEGMLVNIPFGNGNKMITGYIIELGDEPKIEESRIKDIDSIVPDKVQVVGRMIKLASWLKHNYGSTMNQAIRTVIPVRNKIRQKEKKYVCLAVDIETANQKAEEFESKKSAVARARLLRALIEEPVIETGIIKTKLNISMSTVKTLENAGIVTVKAESIYRNPIKADEKTEKRVVLNEQQKRAVDTFIKDYDEGLRNTYLIHGITGSGKTVCYMDMIEHVIKDGKQVIMLIPEIALTFQTVQRFYRRFGDRVSIINSRMSDGERYDQFLRAMRGEIDIIIGPRSALFTPFAHLGLIVIDEEHEKSYKSEVVPRYHARETAVHIAEETKAAVVLGSATPSLEAYYRAKAGKYTLLELDKRATGAQLPNIHIVDLREELKNGNRSIFSVKLQELIQDRLSKGQQTMLFLNKRGYAGFVSCRSCGHVIKCPHCDISLTEHNNGKMMCHYCGYVQPKVTLCPKCGSRYISGFRAGTQQVEEMIKKMFPSARVLRMDMDTTSGKEGHERILSAFANREADILVGTQMIVKGHDFPSVTLVGALAADMSLYASDYRAAERTFQLLVQAAGRAGRAENPGEVVIQTYNPDNYSIVAAGQQDYNRFYEEEITFRSIMGYPPVQHMLRVGFSSENEEKLAEVCDEICEFNGESLQEVRAKFISKTGKELGKTGGEKNEKLFITGPVNAPIYKINDVYTKILYVKAASYDVLTDYKDLIEIYVLDNCKFNNIFVQYDFD